jgi:hypothetical protein
VENFGTNFIYGCINDVRKRLDKMETSDDKITRKIDNAVETIGNGQQDLNEDIMNFITKEFENINNKLVKIKNENIISSSSTSGTKSSTVPKTCKGMNTELTENKKYCNFLRSQNRGKCKNMIKKHEHACYSHIDNNLNHHLEHEVDENVNNPINNIIVESEEHLNNEISILSNNKLNEIIEWTKYVKCEDECKVNCNTFNIQK